MSSNDLTSDPDHSICGTLSHKLNWPVISRAYNCGGFAVIQALEFRIFRFFRRSISIEFDGIQFISTGRPSL